MEDNNIINLDDYRRDKEDEEADAIEAERHYLGLTLKSVLSQMRNIEERAERLRNRDKIRETRREIDEESSPLNDSWFSRTFGFMNPSSDD
jgi:hypothetical protein